MVKPKTGTTVENIRNHQLTTQTQKGLRISPLPCTRSSGCDERMTPARCQKGAVPLLANVGAVILGIGFGVYADSY